MSSKRVTIYTKNGTALSIPQAHLSRYLSAGYKKQKKQQQKGELSNGRK